MISEAAKHRYNTQVRAVAERSEMAIAEQIASLDWDVDYELVKANERYIIAKVYQITGRYGEAAGSLAADMFEACMGAGRKAVVADMAETATLGNINASIHYAAQSLYGEGGMDLAAFSSRCAGITSRMVVSQANRTMAKSAEKHNCKYERVTSGDNVCPLCEELAAKGAVWDSDDLIEPHDGCKCTMIAAPPSQL